MSVCVCVCVRACVCVWVCGVRLDAPESTVTVGQVPTSEQLARQDCSALHKPVASHTHAHTLTHSLTHRPTHNAEVIGFLLRHRRSLSTVVSLCHYVPVQATAQRVTAGAKESVHSNLHIET